MADFRPPSDDELVIRTPRLVLAPAVPGDAPLLFEHCSDARLPRHMIWSPHRDPGETKAFLGECVEDRRAGRGYVWAIREGGNFRGLVGIEGVVRALAGVRLDRAELGYWIGLAFHGRGLATEAAGAATAFAFGRLALHKVRVHAFAENAASLAVIAKLGFRRTGVLRADLWKDGAWHDHVAFEMLAGSAAARRLQSPAAPGR